MSIRKTPTVVVVEDDADCGDGVSQLVVDAGVVKGIRPTEVTQ